MMPWVSGGVAGADIEGVATVAVERVEAEPEGDSARQRKSVTQYGVTWTFTEKASVGQFVNGDFYVVGPVTVQDIQPKPLIGDQVSDEEVSERERRRGPGRGRERLLVRNGSMLNPPARQVAAFDSAIQNYFDPEFVAAPPIRLVPGDCLVSSISLRQGETGNFPYHGGRGPRDHSHSSPVKTAAILTCVDDVLPPDAFRPSYGDREQRIYLARNLRRDQLPRLLPPADTPPLNTWIRIFRRPWINPCFFGFEQPMENMPFYGQWIGQAQSMAGLLLMLDLSPAKKEELLTHVVQVGIDYWGLVRNGHPGWQGWGGHGSGRKFPIVFAGLMLGDDEMASPTKTFPKVEFGEDNQTMFGNGWTGATALFAGHTGIQSALGKPSRAERGPYEHLHPSKWGNHQEQSESYRRANTSSSWVGQALVMRMLGAEALWKHDAFFEYVDRWMTEPDDRKHRQEIKVYHPEFRADESARFARQGNTTEPFVQTMWQRYRSQVPLVPMGDRVGEAEQP